MATKRKTGNRSTETGNGMVTKKITKTGAKRIIKGLEKKLGVVFYVVFTKRTNNERREMRCCFGIQENLKGAGRKFKPDELHLVSVYDMDKSEYRMVSLERIIEIKVANTLYKVK